MSEDRELEPQEPGSGKEKKKKETESVTLGQEMYQTLRSLVWIVLFIILLFTFVVRVTVVDGRSMEDTLHEPDIVLVWSLGYEPRQGDIVVLTKTSFRPQSIIKRVIAVEGQTVDVDYETGTVWVDGAVFEEPDTLKDEPMRVPWWGEGVNHVTIPEGCIFVMGDNRNNSTDSRSPDVGIVDKRCVIGHAMVVVFPFRHLGTL